MTVQELINELRKLPPDLMVIVEGLGPYDDLIIRIDEEDQVVLIDSQESLDELS